MQKQDLSHVGVRIPVPMLNEIERIAKKRDMNNSQVIRMMLDIGLSCHRDMEKVGIIAAVDFAYFVRKSVKEKVAGTGARQLSLI